MTPPALTPSSYETLTADADPAFPEYDTPPPEPIGLLLHWLEGAIQAGVREPKALALATADAQGRPSSRIVACGAINEEGVVFTSHTTSRKGRELAFNPWAAGVLYWRETGQQIILAGSVAALPESDSDALWYDRPVPLHPMSTVSYQSDPLDDPAALRAKAQQLAAARRPLPRPERFIGYRLQPLTVEFWAASPDRLHRRLHYQRYGSGWHVTRLQP
jgi:dihydrophenazinedicarboxylate synthase